MNKFLISVLIIFASVSIVFAYEDCLIFSDGKMTNISLKNHDMIDVYPLVTISNKKNTLIVHPMQKGKTSFSILKNDKDIHTFNVNIKEDETIIEPVKGFEIFSLDTPPSEEDFLDKPPHIKEVK